MIFGLCSTLKDTAHALFLRHEGYLGAIGAYLKGADEIHIDRGSWGESYAGSSGLTSPKAPRTTKTVGSGIFLTIFYVF